jgi:hypothetical protein
MEGKRALIAALTLVSGFAASAAQADVVNWTVRGTVSYFSGSTNAIPFNITPGEGYVLTLTLDDDMPAVTQGSVSSLFANGFIEGTLSFANGSIPLTFNSGNGFGQMTVTNDLFSVQPTGITVTDAINASLAGANVNGLNRGLNFGGSISGPAAPGALTSHNFPTPSEVEAFFAIAAATNFSYSSDINGRYFAQVNGNVTSLEVSAVPLPAAAWLLLSTLGGVLAFKRRG